MGVNRLYILTAVALLAYGCNQEAADGATTIVLNVNESRYIDLLSGGVDLFSLDREEVGLLGSIKNISFSGDNIVVEASNGMFLHDGHNGDMITTFSGRGRSRNEYVDIWSHWVDLEELYIYDMNGKKVLTYGMDGESVATHSINSNASSAPFQLVVPYSNGYIGKRVFDGIGEAEELALYDAEFNFVRSIPAFKIRSGIKFHTPFARYGDVVLYNRYFDNMIYEVNEMGVEERYIVDFSEYSVPNIDSFADEYDILNYIQRKSDDECATLISNIYESDNYLSFNFLFDAERHLALYDKLTSAVDSFYFGGEDISVENISCNRDRVYIFFNDEHCNYVGVIPISDLHNNCHTD